MNQMDTAVVIGRFQPFHLGHLDLLMTAFQTAYKVIVVIGSSTEARTVRNPFTFEERVSMIQNSITDSERRNLIILGVRDYQDDDIWRDVVMREVNLYASSGSIHLIGNDKDATTYYLKLFTAWNLVNVEPKRQLTGTEIRSLYFMERWRNMIPQGTATVLDNFAGTHECWKLQGQYEEYDKTRNQKG